MPKYHRKRVLFICIGNACRSPMAEAIARVDATDAIDAFSAGLAPIGFIEELTKQTLIKNGYLVEGLESKSLLPKVWEQIEWDQGWHGGDPPLDIVINMSGHAIGGPFQECSKVEDWEIEDPYGKGLDVHQRVFEKIRLRVAELAQRCRDECLGARIAERQDPRRHTRNWISVQAPHGKSQEQKDKICEEHNVGLEIPDARQPGNGAPEFSTFSKPISKHHEAVPFPAPGKTAAQTGMPSNKRILRPRSMLAGVQWNLSVLQQRWGTFIASGLRRRAAVILSVLIALVLLASRWLMIRQMAWAAKQTEVSSEAGKPVAPFPMTETPSALNPSAEKTKAQASIVEPLPIEKVESVYDAGPKNSPEPATTMKKHFPNRTVKTRSHSVKNAGATGKPANKPSRAAFNVNVSRVAKTIQAVPSLSQTRPRQEANVLPPADLVVPHPSSDARPDEAKSQETPMPSKQPVPPVDVKGAIAILADPYLSLRIPDGNSSKKQRLDTSLQLGHLLSSVEPIYPEEAKQLGIQGTVKLHAVIGRNGSVETLQPVNGPPMLVAAAVNAVRHWRYTETLLGGQSVETEENIAITFRLSNAAASKE